MKEKKSSYRLGPILVNGQKLIDYVIPGNRVRSRELVRRMIPALIELVRQRQMTTYGELARRIQFGSNRISLQLGDIIRIISELSKQLDRQIPHITGIATYRDGRTGAGFENVVPGFNEMTVREQIEARDRINQEAYDFSDWDDVLAYLDLS